MARTKRWNSEFNDGVQVVTLTSWKYFHDYLQESLIDSNNYVFRGQKDETWKLEPTLVRFCKKNSSLKFESLLKSHLSNFKFAVRGRAKNLKDIVDNADELWALGQHNGLNTPLLDFTESPYVSAYFAFHETETSSKYRVIYGLSQYAINNQLKNELTLFKPLTDHNQRLLGQGGLFVKFNELNDIESIFSKAFKGEEKKVKMYKIKIPNKDRELCLKFLNSMNINHNSLFPDLFGASIYCNTKLDIKNY